MSGDFKCKKSLLLADQLHLCPTHAPKNSQFVVQIRGKPHGGTCHENLYFKASLKKRDINSFVKASIRNQDVYSSSVIAPINNAMDIFLDKAARVHVSLRYIIEICQLCNLSVAFCNSAPACGQCDPPVTPSQRREDWQLSKYDSALLRVATDRMEAWHAMYAE